MMRNFPIKNTLALKKAKVSINRLIDGLFISVLLSVFSMMSNI